MHSTFFVRPGEFIGGGNIINIGWDLLSQNIDDAMLPSN